MSTDTNKVELRYKSSSLDYHMMQTTILQTTHIVRSKIEVNIERKYWDQALLSESVTSHTSIESLITSLIGYISESEGFQYSLKYDDFLEKTKEAYESYLSESAENNENKFPTPSRSSFFQLTRFVPEFPERDLDVYLDADTGFFGVMIKPEINGSPLLNLLMQDNKEVIFSYIKRNNKIIKITGRAYFNDDLNDSAEITKILRMISE